MTSMFEDLEMTLGLGSFTSFLLVSLGDQSREGCGQTVLLTGSQHVVERFFHGNTARVIAWDRKVRVGRDPSTPCS
jgi:hypothetical protein